MDEELVTCNMEFLSISTIAVMSVLFLIGVRKLFRAALKLLRSRKSQSPMAIDLHREVTELRRTTSQISQDWGAVIKSMTTLKDQQVSCQEKLKNEIKSMGDVLLSNVCSSLELEYIRNEKRLTNINKTINISRQDMSALKEMIRNNGEMLVKSIEQYRPSNKNMIHMWAQTEKEIAVIRIPQEGTKVEEENSGGGGPPKTSIKKVLMEIHKEIRKSALKDRQEVMSHLTGILYQMSQDRELIRSAIQQAFATSSYQSQTSFDRFSSIGQEALHYIAEKNEKSNILMKDKFQELDKKLKDIFEGMRSTSFDVSSIKSTLDNIDSQLDDIFKKIELGCQKNVEQCEDVLGGLEMATDVWKESSARLTGMASVICDLNNKLEVLMKELNTKLDDSREVSCRENKNLIESSVFTQEMTKYQVNVQCFHNMQCMAQACTEKLSFLCDRLENGTSDIKMAIENLLRQIQFMCDLVENVGERFRILETENVQENSIKAPFFKQDKEPQGDADTNAIKMKATFSEDISLANNCIPVKDNIVKSPKKAIPLPKMKSYKTSPTKLAPSSPTKLTPTSPTKRGKTIFSGSSQANTYSKSLEQRYRQR